MADQSFQELDLDQILRTLASLPRAEAPTQESDQHAHDESAQAQARAPGVHITQQNIPIHSSVPSSQASTRSNGQTLAPYQPQTLQKRTLTPTIDPATITEWRSGLRCVSKIAAQNPNFEGTVKKLIKDQERHVKEWEAGRQRLVDEQKVKREHEKTQRAALSLPGLLGNTAPLRTPEREKEELDQYHKKVHRACCSMMEAQSVALKGLGVPFFGVRTELIVPGDTGDSHSGPEGGKITKTKLLELQRKMLTHLTELYGD